MRKSIEHLPGLQEQIHPGVWQRHTLWGAPQKWVYAWMAIIGYGCAYTIYALPLLYLGVLVLVWAAGQAGLVLLTKWDMQFDDVLLASWKIRRYKKRYSAG